MVTKYGVNEIFNTIQGEGMFAGVPSTFIRLQGCTVGCPWCDTKYTWKSGGTVMTAPEIVTAIRILPHVVITGGEPTLYNLDELIIAIKTVHGFSTQPHFRIQLETSGQNDFKGSLSPAYVTWSPKINLGYKIAPGLKKYVTEVKWVVDTDLRLESVEAEMAQFGGVTCSLMPEGTPPSPENITKALDWILGHHPTWRFSDRMQWRIGVK